ncbi:hypothetical protein Kpho01_58560 [Kitasatospora phosalacinea]|uniref:Uncharacterized protein n=1 Tax=Kitasatospora phosalacinea TaxID=2065 RepID=A0A9W6PK90_9ACTN|nr:hypothetical protein Kpho01_58560 [Kitasatospora phosalacinea]
MSAAGEQHEEHREPAASHPRNGAVVRSCAPSAGPHGLRGGVSTLTPPRRPTRRYRPMSNNKHSNDSGNNDHHTDSGEGGNNDSTGGSTGGDE